ncbi:MAG: hypothetical protein M3Z64_08945 [Verrucomicrobiota bacterium]|nr:hypothetical protein [Verrucomicrobiota bacterium]
MRLNPSPRRAAFTLSELMISMSIGVGMLAAVLTASIGLQKSLAAADSYFGTHMQQIRIIDYLSRDVKRAYAVTTSPDLATVTCTVPNYVVQLGDVDAGTNGVNIGKRRTPVVTPTILGGQVDYGRTVSDTAIIYNSPTLTSATASFTSADVGHWISGDGIAANTTIIAVISTSTATMSAPAIYSGAGKTATISSTSTVTYSLSGSSILRTENGTVTTIASSTNQLIPSTTDVELANTEYAISAVTFLPTFTFNPNAIQHANTNSKVAGTAVYSRAYMRNRRRN